MSSKKVFLITLFFTLFSLILQLSSVSKVLPSKNEKMEYFENGEKKLINVLLVIAHPDDECMFFTPTLLSLHLSGLYSTHILCLSSGNAYGKGEVRKIEMMNSCKTFNIDPNHVKVINDSDIQDGFDQVWKEETINDYIFSFINEFSIDIIVTFDGYGVSGHPNHKQLHQSVLYFLSVYKNVKINHRNLIEVWELASVNLFRKFFGIFDIFFVFIEKIFHDSSSFHFFVHSSPLPSFVALNHHASQSVWYRWLFVFFSRYSYVNSLKKIELD